MPAAGSGVASVSCSGLRSDSGKYLRRGPSGTPMSFKSLSVRWGSTETSISFSAKRFERIAQGRVSEAVPQSVASPTSGYQRRLEHNADVAGRPDTSRSGVIAVRGRTRSCDKLNRAGGFEPVLRLRGLGQSAGSGHALCVATPARLTNLCKIAAGLLAAQRSTQPTFSQSPRPCLFAAAFSSAVQGCSPCP